ncbi:Nup93/Nic96-domain-containing protein [Spinellus fusiger]|nr:Nup93/Nic96-domain-containing protein [Spinellus fusiger]
MSNTLFEQLYENSKRLLKPSTDRLLPTIERGLSQLTIETEKITERVASRPTEADIHHAHRFLAYLGVDSQKATQTVSALDTSKTFELENPNDTDIESYIRNEQAKIIERLRKEYAVEIQPHVEDESKVQSEKRTENERTLLLSWKEKVVLPETALMTQKEKETMKNLLWHYTTLVNRFNKAMEEKKETLSIARDFSTLSPPSKKSSIEEKDAWDLILAYTEEEEGQKKKEDHQQQEKRTKYSEDSKEAISIRQRLTHCSKAWLEKQFRDHVNTMLLKNVGTLKAGGNPSMEHRLKVYIDLMINENSRWALENIETLAWARVYLLLRCGKPRIALRYATEQQAQFSAEPRFLHYFTQYIDSPDGRLSVTTREDILMDYHRFEFGSAPADPYKCLIYKIMGRCALRNQKIPAVIFSLEDYLWLQLTLVQEVSEDYELGRKVETYTLKDFVDELNKVNPTHFEANGGSWKYFVVLLCSLQFEKAIVCLYSHQETQIVAVHMAIALAYHGLLRLPSAPLQEDGSFLHQNRLNLAHLIFDYVHTYTPQKVADLVGYYDVLSMFAHKPAYRNIAKTLQQQLV